MDGHFMTETTRTCRVWISGMVSRRIWRFVAHLYTAQVRNLTIQQWYDPDAVTTKDGVLELRFDNFTNHDLKYRSGMVQSWNKMCFRGGRLEASISLPGDGEVSGFWPGFWAMGNLGRYLNAAGDGRGYELNAANRLWARDDFSLLEPFRADGPGEEAP